MSDTENALPPWSLGEGGTVAPQGAAIAPHQVLPDASGRGAHSHTGMVRRLNDLPAVASYLARIEAEPRSLRAAVVKQQIGRYWKDLAVIRFLPDGKVKAPDAFMPDAEEAAAISQAVTGATWPESRFLPHDLAGMPARVREADPKDVFTFYDRQENALMVQVRMQTSVGERAYLAYSYWSDDTWRQCEPEGKLPLWGLDGLGDLTTVFIHEGAKAARRMRDMVEARTPEMRQKLKAHPWGAALIGAAHLGWIGGALSPGRTDWDVLREAGVKRVYIVSDNDQPGMSAVPAISKAVRLPCFHVQFTSEWPASFDLGDDFPANMFVELDGVQRYVGPSFRSCLHPATWATDLVEVKGGKTVPVLRDAFLDVWAYVEEADLFVCKEVPEIRRAEAVLNKMCASLSDVAETSRLIVKGFRGRTPKLCYRPDVPGRVVTNRGTSAINLHVPGDVTPREGNPKPWLDFLEYMFPNEEERKEVMRWCATLIARPEVRMHYGILLVSEKQGIGKTTMASSVLAPLVGVHNTGWPGENNITVSDFNGWLAHKRLIVVNEIYSGHSWKAYNRLKEIITDSEITVNEKHQRAYVIENWAHVVACSNSLRALKMENDDRRWFYPQVTETAWPKERFADLRRWLESGGLETVAAWAEGFGDYVASGERAPMTERKRELIAESRSEGQQEAVAIAHAMMGHDGPCALAMKAVQAAVRNATQGKVFDTDAELRKAMMETGVQVWPERLQINGRNQHVILNAQGWERMHAPDMANKDERQRSKAVRDMLCDPANLNPEEM